MGSTPPAGVKRRIVILGGGFGGAYAARELRRRARPDEAYVTLLDRNNFSLFYPLLVEAGVGTLEPRHVVVPIRKFLPHGDFRMAEVQAVDLERQRVQFQVIGCDEPESIAYDHLVIAFGSVTRMPTTIPGLREFGYELKTLGDAIELRDRAIRLLELANTLTDSNARKELLRIVVIGANFTGIELAGEYHAFLTSLARDYANVASEDVQVVVVERSARILDSVDAKLAAWAHRTLAKRGIDIRTNTSAVEVAERSCTLSTGEQLRTRTVVWAAGIAPHPLVANIPGLPLNEKGYIDCERDLLVKGLANVWAIGDIATVYDDAGKPFAATAQNASRQGPLVARNILATLRGESTAPFAYHPLGSFAAIGRRSAAADVMGRNVTGLVGWLMYRGAYLMKLPTFGLKLRVFLDWVLELVLSSEAVQLGYYQRSRKAANPPTSSPLDRPTVRPGA